MDNKNNKILKSFMKVEVTNSFDLVEKKQIEEYVVKVDVKSIQNGLIDVIGVYDFALLMAIASYCDVEGEAFPSQRTLSKITGMSLPQVNKVVNRLLETTINDQPILERKLEKGSKNVFSVYSLYGFTRSEEPKEADQEDKKVADNVETVSPIPNKGNMSARQIVTLYKELYEEEYGFAYVVNYARDTSLVKKKLVDQYTDEQITEMFTYGIKNYASKWKNKNYPYPTISMFCTWLGNVVIGEVMEAKNEQKELEERAKATADYKEADYNDFDNI